MSLEEEEWAQRFQELIKHEKPWAKWTLRLDENLKPGNLAQGWRQYQQRAFGRFQCSACWRSWASAQTQILCHMYWDPQNCRGQVLMRVFGQRCQKCFWSGFEKPEFSSESITQILNNLVQSILDRYYQDGSRKFSRMPVKVEVPLDGPHDRINCEACTLGFCVQGFQSHVLQSAKSSPSTMTQTNGCNSVQKWAGLSHLEGNHGESSRSPGRLINIVTPLGGFSDTNGYERGHKTKSSKPPCSYTNNFQYQSGLTLFLMTARRPAAILGFGILLSCFVCYFLSF
ncbi:receptor-transporting protein 4 [Ochotona princeps]|uniref:receptor-transporting protein 4 n=1 Tax=Ochotona princeps TaxID=9978 RepID=UPI002714DF3C|nr:receptor-transporting protein 4 [Ochotona princeps]